jgi:hypothetical protein
VPTETESEHAKNVLNYHSTPPVAPAPMHLLVISVSCAAIGFGATLMQNAFWHRTYLTICHWTEFISIVSAMLFLALAIRRWTYTRNETVLLFVVIGLVYLIWFGSSV